MKGLIRAILDVAGCAQHRQEYGRAEVVGLLVGGYFDLVVVGQHEADFNALDLAEIVDGVFCARGKIFDVIGQGDDICTAGHNCAAAANAAFDHGDDVSGVLDAIDEDAPAGQQCAALAVFGRIVGNAHDNRADKVRVHRAAEQAAERVVAKGQVGVAMRRIDKGRAESSKIPDLHPPPSRHQGGEGIGLDATPDFASGNFPGVADPRRQHGQGVLVGHKVPLDAVESRLGKRQGSQGCADAIAHHQGRVELPGMARRYEQVVEPRTKARIFGDDAAVVFWVVFGPVVHQPALGDVIAVHVVERRAFQKDIGVALVVVAGVVGVLLLPPVVL